MSDFVDRIDVLLKARNLKRSALCDALGLSSTSITDWNRRGTIPSADVAIMIARYLGVSVEFLVLGEEKEKPPEKNECFCREELLAAIKILEGIEKRIKKTAPEKNVEESGTADPVKERVTAI